MGSKTCTKCGETKSLDLFYKYTQRRDGRRSACKVCEAKRDAISYNKDIKESRKKARDSKRRNTETSKKYRENNRKKRRAVSRVWEREKYQNDPVFATRHKVKSRMRIAIRRIQDGKKSRASADIIGCTWKELWDHLCNTFEANYGMPREWLPSFNYDIDHIIPLATSTTEEEVIKLNHYSNLQILLREDNLDKSDKLDWSLEC